MGSLRGETMAVRRHVVYPSPSNPISVRRRDAGETSSAIASSGVRSAYLVGGVDVGALRQRSSSSSSGRGYQPASPSAGSRFRSTGARGQTATVTTGSEHGLKGQRTVNGWTHGQQSDVVAFASDTEAISASDRYRRQPTNNDDVRWHGRLYMSANDLRHNSPGQSSSRSSTSGRESASGSILKKRPDGSARFETSSSCSSSTIVGSVQDKYTDGRSSGEIHKSHSPSERLRSDSSTSSSSSPSRRVGFKSNVAVYRFDSDGEDSAGYSSTVSETSEQLDGHPRTHSHRQHHRRPTKPQPNGTPPHHDRPVPPASHDAAASWAAARGWSAAADRVVSPRYVADDHQDRHHQVADNVPGPTRLHSNSAGNGRPQFTTISRTQHVADGDDNVKRRRNGSVCSRTSKYDHPARDHTQIQRRLSPDEGCVLSCGSVAVHKPVFVDRAHYEYLQAEKGLTKRLVLTCSLKHVNHFDPDCLVVKANRAGTRARVVFNAETNARHDYEQSDQLLLPYTVDPYCLTAQLQGDNSLVIEAPVLHCSSNE